MIDVTLVSTVCKIRCTWTWCGKKFKKLTDRTLGGSIPKKRYAYVHRFYNNSYNGETVSIQLMFRMVIAFDCYEREYENTGRKILTLHLNFVLQNRDNCSKNTLYSLSNLWKWRTAKRTRVAQKVMPHIFYSKYVFLNHENYTQWRVMVFRNTLFFHKVSSTSVCVCLVGTVPCSVHVATFSLRESHRHQPQTSHRG
jgi:hypothetical protein